MKGPKSIFTVLAIIFISLSLFYLLFWTLSSVVEIHMSSGKPEDFLPLGSALLLAGIISLSLAGFKRWRKDYLSAHGVAIQARVIAVEQRGYVRVNSKHPWTVLCEYIWEGVTYTVSSQYLWSKPVFTTVLVFVDPSNPKHAVVDL